MSEKDYYEQLLKKMNNISSNLNTILKNIETLKDRTRESIKINDNIYKIDEIDKLKEEVEAKLSRINNNIIPAIKDKIEELEREEEEENAII